MFAGVMFCAATSVSMAAALPGFCGLERGDEAEDAGEGGRGLLLRR